MRGLPPTSCEIIFIFSSEAYHVVFNFFWPFLTADGDSCYRGDAFVVESRFIKHKPLDNVQSKCPNNDGELLASNLRTTNFLHDYLRTAFGNHSVFGFGPMSATLSSLITLSKSSSFRNAVASFVNHVSSSSPLLHTQLRADETLVGELE